MFSGRFKRNTNGKSSKKYVVHLPTPVCSIAQLVERRSSNHEILARPKFVIRSDAFMTRDTKNNQSKALKDAVDNFRKNA